MQGRHWVTIIALSLGGCSNEIIEGQIPGECSDGADNDADGYFDCDDNNCWGAPDCKDAAGNGSGNNGGNNDGGDVDTDPPDLPDDAVAGHLQGMSMRYRVDWEWEFIGGLGGLGGISGDPCAEFASADCNCSAEYVGDGLIFSATDTENTYKGSFRLDSSNCPTEQALLESSTSDEILNDLMIWRPNDEEAYHTFSFSPELDELAFWVAHNNIADREPLQNAMRNKQFWIRFTEDHELGEGPDWVLVYEEAQVDYLPDLLAQVTATSRLVVDFDEPYVAPEIPDLPEE